MGFFNLLFSFDGRINRNTWWICGLVFSVLKLVLDAVFSALLGSSDDRALVGALDYRQFAAAGLSTVVLLYPMLAVGAKRMHDRNKSGWWMGAFMLPAVAMMLILPALTVAAGSGATISIAGIVVLLTVLTIVAVLWNIVECGFLKGTPGDNDYGPPHRLADVFGAAEERDSKWATAIDMSAHVATTVAQTQPTSPSPSPAARRTSKLAPARASGFGRRMPARP